jgi:5-methylcytosine-specific restriction endonuclease McrA
MPGRYRVCQNCGDPYLKKHWRPKDEGNQYCSRECAFEDAREWAGGTPARTAECWKCGETYLVARSGAERFPGCYCSEPCESRGVSRECPCCGKAFRATSAPNERYCGDECRLTHQRHVAMLAWRQERQGQAYTARRPREGRCITCGGAFLGDSAQKYCSLTCRPSTGSGVSRHLPYLLKRDRRRCQICGGAVAWTKKVPHPKAPTADHIVPRSKGGSDDRRNLQLAHWRCNAAKGSGSAGSQLRCVG